MKKWFTSGSPWIWLTAGSVAISLLALGGLLFFLSLQGMRYFWPAPVYEFELNRPYAGQTHLLAEIYREEQIPRQQLQDAGVELPSNSPAMITRYLLRIASADLNGSNRHENEFLHVLAPHIQRQQLPNNITIVELKNQQRITGWGLPSSTATVSPTTTLRTINGDVITLDQTQINRMWYPNNMTLKEKWQYWWEHVSTFLTDDTQNGNYTHGAFPAIVGTVLMVILMSIIVMPLGVIAAVYLHEYAKNTWLTRLIRIAVINLAGVPSIVYGVFGLGFFVYMIGGTLDQLFFSDQLPVPTLGTPGVLWSALTLSLLTLPVVIVSTEEGLSRIPYSLRQGSLALGATRAETLRRVILPMTLPSMLTGLILAVARAAGETAPLMLVGVVKSVPMLPIDDTFPYLHLERKFMHLSFQIYDFAFQSANVEAALPLAYASALLLVLIIVLLNLAAIGIRHHLREKYRIWSQ